MEQKQVNEKVQFEANFYAELRELGYRINNSSQLHPKKFNYDVKIIPVFKKYLEIAEQKKAYYVVGPFSNYIQKMLLCLMSKKMKDVTGFLIEHYKFAITNNAPWIVRDSYAMAIFAIQDDRFIDEYFSLFTDKYITSTSACLLEFFYDFKVTEAEDLLIRLIDYRDKPKRKQEEKYFYNMGGHIDICAASITVLGKMKSKKALPYIEEYLLEPENKTKCLQPEFFDKQRHRDFAKVLQRKAQEAIDSIHAQ